MSYITKGYLATQLKNLSNRISEVFAKKTDVDSALNGKSDAGHTHTKSQVGLSNVDNTADANKYVKYAESAGSATEDSEGNVISEKFNTLNENEFAIWDTGSYEISGYYNTSSGAPIGGGYVLDPRNGDIYEVSFITSSGGVSLPNPIPQWKKVGTGTLKAYHTHNYAGSNSAGGNALKLQLSREGTDANWLPDNGSTMQMRELHSASSNLPEENFFQIIACRSGDEGYGSQLAMGMTTNNLYFRNYLNGKFNSWRKVAFTEGNDSLTATTLKADYLLAGDKVLMYTDSEGGNVTWTSAGNVKWEFDCLGEQFRLFNYLTFKDFKITQDGDVHCPKDLYTSSGIVSTSDKNKKHDIEEISDDFSEKIVDGLIPSSFKFDDGTSGRTHFGIIAQDLEKLLEALGISTTDFAPLVKLYPDKKVKIENPHYDENDEHSEKYVTRLKPDYDAEPIYNVRYEEFIMILVKYCQGLKKKDLELEQRIAKLEEKVNKLIAD